MAKARDKFWLFGVRPHQDDIWLGKRREERDRAWSRITPREGAAMLDVPNMLMVNCDGVPAPFSEEAYGYAESFCGLDRVLWSSTGSAGFRAGNEEAFICELAKRYPNIAGAYMDDVFGRFADSPDRNAQIEAFFAGVRRGLDNAPRRMDIYITWYTHQVDGIDPRVLRYIDGLTLWTWNCGELTQLEERYAKLEAAFPSHKKLLGIYMYDFPSGMPVPAGLMEHQCELGLRLMREGRLDGLIFEANSVMGAGLPSERWLTDWVRRVKDTEVPD